MAGFQQLLSCLFLQSSVRGKTDYRLAGAPWNTERSFQQGLALSPFYKLIHESLLELGEKSCKKNLHFAIVSSPGT